MSCKHKSAESCLNADECAQCLREAAFPTSHAGDCTIYAVIMNPIDPLAGICTCGYGWFCTRQGDWSKMYSREYLEERKKKL